MRIINVKPKMDALLLGKQGENKSTKFLFDVSGWLEDYPGCSIGLNYRPAKSNVSYPCILMDENNGKKSWLITSSELVNDGDGLAELVCILDEVVEKDKRTWKTKVMKSLGGSGTAPDPWENWEDTFIELAERAEDAAEDADDAASDAEAYAVGKRGGTDVSSDDPAYHNNSKYYSEEAGSSAIAAAGSATTAGNKAQDAEAYGVGKRGGVDVESTDPAYHNNAKYFSEQASGSATAAADSATAAAASAAQAGSKANRSEIAKEYADLTYPVTKGTWCWQEGVLYEANQTIATSEAWTAAHWTQTTIEAEQHALLTEINSGKDKLESLAENGFYTEEADNNIYLHFSIGQVSSIDLSIYDSAVDRAYRFLTAEDEQNTLKFDTSVYNISIIYVNGESVASSTAWLGSSPIVFDSSITHTSVVINVKRLDGAVFSQNELDGIIYYTESERVIGNLATKEYVDKKTTKGIKCVYPDSFTSRIKPDIYFNGSFYADLDIDSYKLTGVGEVWVSTDGNDTTGTGAENNPYATITKALTTSAKTIHIKAGTYVQETHYSKWADLKGRNFIGHGTVVFQNDSAGHTLTATGSAYFENITFKHGNSSVNPTFTASCAESNQHICFVKCVFCDAGDNGLSVLGIDAVLVECVAHSNKLDGFNYHKNTSNGTDYIPNVIEINCSAHDNGSSAGSNTSCNGSTSHEGARVIRLNGEYYSCYGGVVADIANDGETVTISVNYGVLAHESTVTGDNCASFWASSNTEMYLYDCSCYGGTYDITALNDAKVVSRRLTTGRDVPSVNKASGATVLQY